LKIVSFETPYPQISKKAGFYLKFLKFLLELLFILEEVVYRFYFYVFGGFNFYYP